MAEHKGAAIFIDYSHKPEALRTALAFAAPLRQEASSASVFGCGGDRDKGKRPQDGRKSPATLPMRSS